MDKLLFLGSGASVCAGAPTFSNFREKAEKISEKKHKKTLDFWRDNYKDYNIEEYYTAIEMRELCILPTEITSQDIIELIATTIERSLKNHKRTPHYYLANRKELVIITTNWDYLLESYGKRLEKGSIDYYGIEKYSKPLEDPWEEFPYKIFKLHGSLNWGICKNCNKIYYFDQRDYVDLKNGTATCKTCKSQLQQHIVPPTFSKLEREKRNQDKEQLNNIWREASHYLASCEYLYFIGYSFPETDAQMKIFVTNALRDNQNLKKVIVVTNQKFGKTED